jgi:ferrous-iron efflux pump FieF
MIGKDESALAMRRAAQASVALASVLVTLKAVAWFQSGSLALLGSLADTGLDLLASLLTLGAVWYASQPADNDHRFGHGKAEAIAALMQCGLILVSAVAIAWRGTLRLMNPEPVQGVELGIGVSILAILGTLMLVAYQRAVVRKTGSVAIRTDNLHYESDLALNLAVIAALAAEHYLRWQGLDALAGIGIAVWLAWSAIRAARGALDMLMDREFPLARRADIVNLVQSHPAILGVHELRTRSSGLSEFIQFHIWVDPQMSVLAAHEIADEAEAKLQAAFPRAEILIHVDPAGHDERGQQLAET